MSPDFKPTCPSCGTEATPMATTCPSCDARLFTGAFSPAGRVRGRYRKPAPPPSDRYVVRTVTGGEIRLEGGRGCRSYKTLYYVLDSAVCYRIVRSFRTRKVEAERCAARLNREDAVLRAAA